ATEEALEADAGERLALAGGHAALLCLDHDVQIMAPMAIRHGAAGVLVHEDELAVAHEVIAITVQRMTRRDRGADHLLAPQPDAPRPPATGREGLQESHAAAGERRQEPMRIGREIAASRETLG